MDRRHAICIVVDGLRASALGAYGNTIYPTPQLDALAARAAVVEWLWADSPRLEGFYRSVWHGRHALRPSGVEEPDLISKLSGAAVAQWLVTDEPWLIEQSIQQPWDDTLLCESEVPAPAEDLADTALGMFFADAVERLADWKAQVDEQDASSLAWIHTRGMHGPWDAPPELRASLLEEDDPPLPDVVAPRALIDVEDPDALLAYRVAYAAQVLVLDACVGAFLDAMDACFAGGETLVMLVGARGFALGEHGAVGGGCRQLFGEQLHLPWLVHVAGNQVPLARQIDLRQPADLPAMLLDWLRVDAPACRLDGRTVVPALSGVPGTARTIAFAGDQQELAVRTLAWMLRRTPTGDQLYSKPDDRWEFNDVAARCPQVVEALGAELDRLEQCCQSDKPLPLTPTDEDLNSPAP